MNKGQAKKLLAVGSVVRVDEAPGSTYTGHCWVEVLDPTLVPILKEGRTSFSGTQTLNGVKVRKISAALDSSRYSGVHSAFRRTEPEPNRGGVLVHLQARSEETGPVLVPVRHLAADDVYLDEAAWAAEMSRRGEQTRATHEFNVAVEAWEQAALRAAFEMAGGERQGYPAKAENGRAQDISVSVRDLRQWLSGLPADADDSRLVVSIPAHLLAGPAPSRPEAPDA